MRAEWTDDTRTKGVPVRCPADLVGLSGGTVTITGTVPEATRTVWSLHLGNYATRGGSIITGR